MSIRESTVHLMEIAREVNGAQSFNLIINKMSSNGSYFLHGSCSFLQVLSQVFAFWGPEKVESCYFKNGGLSKLYKVVKDPMFKSQLL